MIANTCGAGLQPCEWRARDRRLFASDTIVRFWDELRRCALICSTLEFV